MSGLVVPQVVYGLSNEELAELVAKALKEIDWAFNGNISDQNISRIANFLASKTEFKHISGLVGLSGYDAANPLAVRLWAGNSDKSIGPWRVLQNGYMYSTRGFIGGWDIDEDRLSGTGTIEGGTIIGSEIMTALAGVYPRSAMSVADSLFVAEQSGTEFIKIMSDYLGAVALLIYSSTVNGLIGPVGDLLLINTAHTKGGIQISSGGDLELYADILDSSKVVKVNAWNRFVNQATGDNLQYELSRLQSGIDSKQPLITSGDVTVIDGVAYLDDTGIAPGTWTKATYGSDGRATVGASLSAADIPTLAPSKISTDSSNRFVTDTEKTTWNTKANRAQEAWITPTLANSWADYNATTYYGAGYYKDEMGTVHLKGLIKNGTLGASAFTLPAGYRSSKLMVIGTIAGSGATDVLGRLDINASGNVIPNSGGNTYFSLDGISFRADS